MRLYYADFLWYRYRYDCFRLYAVTALNEVRIISLVTIALPFVCGLLTAELFSFFPFLTILLFLLFLRFYLCSQNGQRSKTAVVIVFGIGFIFSYTPSLPVGADDLDLLVDRGPMKIVARVNQPPLHSPDRITLQIKAESYFQDGQNRPVRGLFRVTIMKPATQIEYGDLLEMDIILHPPRQFGNPGVFQSADYLKRQGLSATASLPDERRIRKIGEGGNWFLKEIYRYRDEIRKKTLADISAPTGPILLAMVLGESGYLTDPIRDVFTDSGTNHILSISGSHLAMVSFFVFGFLRFMLLRLPTSVLLRGSLLKIPSQWAALVTAIAVTFYTLLAGGQVATLRSLTMILAYLLALWIGRSVNILRSISLAAMMSLIVQPRAIFDISFQLSYLAVIFIVLVSEWWNRIYPKKEPVVGGYNRITQAILPLLIASFGATLGTAPLTLYYFHQFSWVGWIANVVLIPYTGFVVLPLWFVSAMASPFSSHFPLSGWNEAIGSFYFTMTSFFASFPGADIHFSSPHLLLVILFLVIMATLLMTKTSLRLVFAAVAIFFILFLGMGRLRPAPKSLQVTFLDVGQGDGAFIEFPGGQTMLVDAGSGMPFDVGKAAIIPFLWERKIGTIDDLIGTHPQMDHIGGVGSIIKKFTVKNLFTNGMNSPRLFYQTFLKAAADAGLTPRGINGTDPPIERGGCKVVFLNPIASVAPNEKDMNNHSIVFRLSCPSLSDSSFLFTGDIEKKAIDALLGGEQGAGLRSDILKVPHHGGKGSLDDRFLNHVSPKIAIFSVGERNRYGHPHPMVVMAYKQIGAKIYRTDQDGAITVTLNRGEGFSLRSFREGKMKKVRFDRPIFMQEIENLKKGIVRIY